jgi:hypothetical protein
MEDPGSSGRLEVRADDQVASSLYTESGKRVYLKVYKITSSQKSAIMHDAAGGIRC